LKTSNCKHVSHGKHKAILEAAGYSLDDVVQSTVYLSSMSLFEEFNLEYANYFESDFPTRATVGIELKSGALVEVSVVAYKDLPR
jgi:2-iminobutanoate/2-iminopropanoate deaminase